MKSQFYPNVYEEFRPGTFMLKELQFGIADLNYHAMNKNGVYVPFLNVEKLSAFYDFNLHLDNIHLEATKLAQCGCNVEREKQINRPFPDILSDYQYYGQIFMDDDELSELIHTEPDKAAFDKLLNYLQLKTSTSKKQLLSELNKRKKETSKQ